MVVQSRFLLAHKYAWRPGQYRPYARRREAIEKSFPDESMEIGHGFSQKISESQWAVPSLTYRRSKFVTSAPSIGGREKRALVLQKAQSRAGGLQRFRGSVLIAQGCFRGFPFDSGTSTQDREHASQTRIAYERFAAPGAFVDAVTQISVRVPYSDLEIVSA